MDLAAFAANLREARRAAGLTQEEVSDRSAVHVTEVSRLERGLRDPRVTTVIRLAKALEIEPGELFRSG